MKQVQHYLISSHGRLCKQNACDRSSIVQLPDNVAIILNCKNSQMWSGIDFDCRLWSLATNEKPFKYLKRAQKSCHSSPNISGLAFKRYAREVLKLNYKRSEDMQNEYCVYVGTCPNISVQDDDEGHFRTGVYQLPVKVSVSENEKYKGDITSDMLQRYINTASRRQVKEKEIVEFLSPSSSKQTGQKYEYSIQSLAPEGFISTCLPSKKRSQPCVTRLTLSDVIDSLRSYYNMKMKKNEEVKDNFNDHFHVIFVSACTCGPEHSAKNYSLTTGLGIIYNKLCTELLLKQPKLYGGFNIGKRITYKDANGDKWLITLDEHGKLQRSNLKLK